MFLDLLRISALQGRFGLIERLFQIIRARQIPCALSYAVDRFGWNIAHFIALHSSGGKFPEIDVAEIHELMDIKNQMGASPRDFVLWLSDPSPQSAFAFGEQKPPLNALEVQQLMGRSHWVRPKITPGALLRTHFESSEIERSAYLSPLLDETINRYVDSVLEGSYTPNIKVRKMEGSHVPASMQGQWECLTSRDLQKGDVVAIYSGTIRHLGWDASVKVCNKAHFVGRLFVDADCGGGSLAELINHGFPNCAIYLHCYRGLPLWVIIALEPLRENTILYYDYGTQHFKNLEITPITLNQKDIDLYLQTTKNLRKISPVEIFPDGSRYFFIDRGRVLSKDTDIKATMSQAIDAWAHTARITYLARHHLDEMKKKLDKSTLKLLTNDFIE
ncbi:MAG: SET domain-containing protein [Chlamydiae bacterium]|nr:SET domain-containing protein [Chlamydiota bacterium]